jgi:hypothetical protein
LEQAQSPKMANKKIMQIKRAMQRKPFIACKVFHFVFVCCGNNVFVNLKKHDGAQD